MINGRRFYGFSDTKDVKEHIAQIKNLGDMLQLMHDVKESRTNLTQILSDPAEGISILHFYGTESFEHVFFTAQAYAKLQEKLKGQEIRYTVLED